MIRVVRLRDAKEVAVGFVVLLFVIFVVLVVVGRVAIVAPVIHPLAVVLKGRRALEAPATNGAPESMEPPHSVYVIANKRAAFFFLSVYLSFSFIVPIWGIA